MFMRVSALVFLFLIRLRFPHSKSVAEVIRKRYGQNTVKKLRKLEKPRFLQSIISETNNLWGSSSFLNYSKFYGYVGNAEKNWANISWFWGNCIWYGCVRRSLLLRENTCHRVSIFLTNSLKISDHTKIKFFELILYLNDQKIWQKFCRAYLSSVSDPLLSSLSISVLTRAF